MLIRWDFSRSFLFILCVQFAIELLSMCQFFESCTHLGSICKRNALSFPRIYHFSISIELHLHFSSFPLAEFLNISHGIKVVSKSAKTSERARKLHHIVVSKKNHFSIYFPNKNAIDSRMKKLEKQSEQNATTKDFSYFVTVDNVLFFA